MAFKCRLKHIYQIYTVSLHGTFLFKSSINFMKTETINKISATHATY